MKNLLLKIKAGVPQRERDLYARVALRKKLLEFLKKIKPDLRQELLSVVDAVNKHLYDEDLRKITGDFEKLHRTAYSYWINAVDLNSKYDFNQLIDFCESLDDCFKHLLARDYTDVLSESGICGPIVDISEFYEYLVSLNTLTEWEISRLIGLAICFDSKYAKRNPDHGIKNIEIIHKLASFYDMRGAIKIEFNFDDPSSVVLWDVILKDNCDCFVSLMNSLLSHKISYSNMREYNGFRFISSFCLFVTGCENSLDDDFKSRSDVLKNGSNLDETVRFVSLGSCGERRKLAAINSKLLMLERVYYRILANYMSSLAFPVCLEYLKSVSDMFIDGLWKESANGLLDKRLIQIISNSNNCILGESSLETAETKMLLEKMFIDMKSLVLERLKLRVNELETKISKIQNSLSEQGTEVLMPPYSYSGSAIPYGEQKFINMVDFCFIRRGESCTCEHFPEGSGADFLKQLNSMPDTTYNHREKRNIRDALKTFFALHLGDEPVWLYMSEEDRCACWMAKLITKTNPFMGKNDDCSEAEVMIPYEDNKTNSNKIGSNIFVSRSQYAIIEIFVADLKYILDDAKKSNMDVTEVMELVSDRIREFKEALEGKVCWISPTEFRRLVLC